MLRKIFMKLKNNNVMNIKITQTKKKYNNFGISNMLRKMFMKIKSNLMNLKFSESKI